MNIIMKGPFLSRKNILLSKIQQMHNKNRLEIRALFGPDSHSRLLIMTMDSHNQIIKNDLEKPESCLDTLFSQADSRIHNQILFGTTLFINDYSTAKEIIIVI